MVEKKLPKQLLKKGKLQRGFSPDTSEVPVEDIEAPNESILDQVERDLRRDGIVLFDNENILKDYLRLPADITEVPSKDLGRYFNTLTQQKVWVRTLLSRVCIMIRELENELDDIRYSTYSELPIKMSVKEKELQLQGNAKEQLERLNILESKKLMLSNYLESLTDVLFVVSREVTRRESDWNEDKRDNSIYRK